MDMNDIKNKADFRYNEPKESPKASEELVNNTIAETEIYRKAKLAILQAQKKQVAYGLDKYPEPLNPNTWDVLETIDHIIEESVDRLHYLVMLRIKMEQQLVKVNEEDISSKFVKAMDEFGNIHVSGADTDGDEDEYIVKTADDGGYAKMGRHIVKTADECGNITISGLDIGDGDMDNDTLWKLKYGFV